MARKKAKKKYKFSAEHRAKMSAAQKKSWQNPEVAESRVAPRRGQKRSAETKKKMSVSRRKRRGGHTDPKLIARMQEARRGSTNSPAHRAKISAAKKQWHADNPERSQEIITEATKANKYFDNKLELKMVEVFNEIGVEFVKQYRVDGLPVPHRHHKWDFRVKDEKILIEIDGCYWHGCEAHSSIGRRRELREHLDMQAARDTAAEAHGWKVVRFWEHELNESMFGVAMVLEDELAIAQEAATGAA